MLDAFAPLAAFSWAATSVVGFLASLHCFAMCGPLACAAGSQSSKARAILAYQGARLAAYALVGGLLGAVGEGVGSALSIHLAAFVPWILAATLIAAALNLGGRLAPIPGLLGVFRRVGLFAQRLPGTSRALLLGAITPLLPCGLLYGMFATSVATASFVGGALALGAFGLGAIPALLVAQVAGARLLLAGSGPALLARRAIPAVAAMVLVYRALHAGAGHPTCH